MCLKNLAGSSASHLSQPKDLDNGGQDERSVDKGGKGGKCYSIREEICDVSRYLDGEACLADAAGPCKGEQPHVRSLEEIRYLF